MTIHFENYGAFYLNLTYADGTCADYYNPHCGNSLGDCMEFIHNRMTDDLTIVRAVVCDWETGEVVATVERDNEDFADDGEPSWIDDDCGFDPYLGCYSDDC